MNNIERRLNAAPQVKADKVGPGQSFTIQELNIAMRLIPPGKFWMGSPAQEEGRADDEFLHEVEITRPCYLAADPVTRGQFRHFVQAENYKSEAERSDEAYGWTGSDWKLDSKLNWLDPRFKQDDDHPVVCVSWNGAQAFCAWLSKKTGQIFDLPTEAVWEYACRGRLSGTGAMEITSDPYWFGSTISPKQANFTNTLGGTSKVGAYAANGFGLIDMHGNVWEWCRDWYGDKFYQEGPKDDPQGPSGEPSVFCVAVPGATAPGTAGPLSALAIDPTVASVTAVFGCRAVVRLREVIALLYQLCVAGLEVVAEGGGMFSDQIRPCFRGRTANTQDRNQEDRE